jgi:ribosomal protein L16 Arg81 hydroxylase
VQVDAEAPDLARFPRFAHAQPWAATLDPGDVVYIPRRWWHHVRALSKATSVSLWWL